MSWRSMLRLPPAIPIAALTAPGGAPGTSVATIACRSCRARAVAVSIVRAERRMLPTGGVPRTQRRTGRRRCLWLELTPPQPAPPPQHDPPPGVGGGGGARDARGPVGGGEGGERRDEEGAGAPHGPAENL